MEAKVILLSVITATAGFCSIPAEILANALILICASVRRRRRTQRRLRRPVVRRILVGFCGEVATRTVLYRTMCIDIIMLTRFSVHIDRPSYSDYQ